MAVDSLAFDAVGAGNPRLYSKDVTLTNTSSAVTSLDLTFVSSSGGHTVFFAVSGAATASSSFTPIAVTGYNEDMVVETGAKMPYNISGGVTVTMDNGLALGGNTWYEQGYIITYPLTSLTGLPPAGSILTNAASADHTYQLPPSYATDDCAFVDSTHSPTLTPATPAAFTALSFLSSAGHGPVTNEATIYHLDGSTETAVFVTPDWFNGTPVAFNANGRIDLTGGQPNNVYAGNPRLYAAEFPLANSTSPVTSINVSYLGSPSGTNAHTVIFAVSGTAGALAALYTLEPLPITNYANAFQQLSAAVEGTPPFTYQWQKGTNGVWVDLADNGLISGSTTTNLTFAYTYTSDTADYRMLASNVAGVVPSVAVHMQLFSTDPPVTSPTDQVTPFGGTSPTAEVVTYAIDGTTSKYLNFGTNGGVPFAGPVGFVVTPAMGATVVTGMRLFTANDSPERDPANYVLEGSTDGGHTYTTIGAGPLALPDARNTTGLNINPLTQSVVEIDFTNTGVYTTYRWTVNQVKNSVGGTPLAANSMQIGEVQILGGSAPQNPPSIIGPTPIVAYLDSTATLNATVLGNPIPTIQWFKLSGNTIVTLHDGGNVFGSQNASLTLVNLASSDAGSYLLYASNSLGSLTSSIASLTIISTLQDVTQPGDPITDFGDKSNGEFAANEVPAYAIDDTLLKYQNGGSGFSAPAGFPPFQGPVGLVVTPSMGVTMVSGLRIYTADGNGERDPADYTLEGSTDGGTNYSLISSGGLSLPLTRNAPGATFDPTLAAMQEVIFPNDRAFTSYRITFNNVRNNGTANSLQFGELELLGISAGSVSPTLNITAGAGGSLTLSCNQSGTLQSTTLLAGSNTVWVDEGPISGTATITVSKSIKAKFYRVSVP